MALTPFLAFVTSLKQRNKNRLNERNISHELLAKFSFGAQGPLFGQKGPQNPRPGWLALLASPGTTLPHFDRLEQLEVFEGAL